MIGILGGTFDPVHNGHLRLALEILEEISLREVRIIPARHPPHRAAPAASVEDRVAMLETALANSAGLYLDRRELQRQGPSYMVDTLGSLREEHPETPLGLILGMDAFCTLDTWHKWRQLSELAHIIIADRPGSPLPKGEMAVFLGNQRVSSPRQLRSRLGGYVFVHHAPHLDISATRIRSLVANRRSPRYLLPVGVLEIINKRGLYLGAS